MMRDLGVLDWAERAMADGRIGHLGFSFHDKYEAFQEIVDAYDGWTFCQIQYNYMDEQEQAGVRGLNYAADKGLAVVVMEPLRGGMLAGDVPEPVQAIWDAAPLRRSPADWALQWLWNQPAVSLVLSGMSTLAQVEQNIASAEQSMVGALTPDDLALIGRVRDKYRELCPIPCTDCKYCLPCPERGRHPAHLCAVQRGEDVQRRGALALCVSPVDSRGGAGQLLPPVRRVRGEVSAGHHDHGLAGEGGHLAGG